MAEVMIGPDGQPVDIEAAEQDFHAAMAAPEPDQAPDYPAPPRCGTKADGSPKLAAGRPRKEAADKARTTAKAQTPPKAKGKESSADYTETLASFGQAVWMGLAAVPLTHAQAIGAVWKLQLPAQVQAWNAAAQQDPGVRRAVEKLSAGPTWVIGVAIATAPLVGAGVAIVRDPEVRAQLAEQTQAEFAAFIQSATAAAENEENADPEPERAAA